MNLGGLEGSVTTLGGRVNLSGKAAGLARRAVYSVGLLKTADYGSLPLDRHDPYQRQINQHDHATLTVVVIKKRAFFVCPVSLFGCNNFVVR